jgi:hypothetical protein
MVRGCAGQDDRTSLTKHGQTGNSQKRNKEKKPKTSLHNILLLCAARLQQVKKNRITFMATRLSS